MSVFSIRLSAEKGEVVDFHRGEQSGMDGGRSGWMCQLCRDCLSGQTWQSWQSSGSWRGWQLQQTWTGTEAEAAEAGAKQGSVKEGTSLCGEGGKSVSGAGINALTHIHTRQAHICIHTHSFSMFPSHSLAHPPSW